MLRVLATLAVLLGTASAQAPLGGCQGLLLYDTASKGCIDTLQLPDFTCFTSQPGMTCRPSMSMTGNVPSFFYVPAASCVGGVAVANWDTPASDAPTAACVTGSNGTIKGILNFDDGTTGTAPSIQLTAMLSAKWMAGPGIVVDLRYYTGAAGGGTGISGNVRWCGQYVCTAADTTDDNPTFGTAVCVTDPARTTALQTNNVTITMTGSTCAANNILHLKLYRDSDDPANDTTSGDATLIGGRVTSYRTIP